MGRKKVIHIPTTPGVYLILNNKTMKFYIGSTKNLYTRIAIHKSSIKKQTHFNNELQQDILLYGYESFQFLVVKEFDNVKEARACEAELLHNFVYKQFIYNLLNTGKPFSEKTRVKMREAKRLL